MWGQDEEDYRQSVIEEAAGYVTKDSGEKAVHSDGVQRDTNKGKTLFPLMFPKGVPMKDQLIVRLAELYTRGAEKYGGRNWEGSKGDDTLEHHLDALWRHFMSFYFEENAEEDHAAAIIWNINAVELTRRNQRLEVAAEVRHELTDEQARAVIKAAVAVCSQCHNAWPCKQGCEYAMMVKPQLSESDIAFDDVSRSCQENFKAADSVERDPNDHRYH
jgi:hypothetical protein